MSTAVAGPAWAAYAAGSEVDHFEAFCTTYLRQWVGRWAGQRLELYPEQRQMMGEALAFDDRGLPVWQSVVIVLPRKNGKTVGQSALAAYRLVTSDDYPEVLLAASSDKQAGRLFEGCAIFTRKSSYLRSVLRVRDHVGEIAREDGLGKIIRLSKDAGTQHGYNPSLVICDELHAWTTPTLRRSWGALTTGGGAREDPQTFTITTAGEAADRHEPILGALLDSAERDGEVEKRPGLTIMRVWDARMLVYYFHADLDPEKAADSEYVLTEADFAAIKQANPAPWITDEYLRKQAVNPELTRAQFLQLHANIWAAGSKAWLPTGAWDRCADPDRDVMAAPEWYDPAEEGGDFRPRVVLAFDGSYNNDSSALVGCTVGDRPHVFVVGAWERPAGKDGEGWKVPRDEVEATIARAMERFEVLELACDPPGWHKEIGRWADSYGTPPVVDFETNRPSLMSPACSKLYTAVATEAVSHDGDRRLARHVANAVVKETADGAYIVKDGRSSPRKIDLAVAAVIAHDRAVAQGGDGGFDWGDDNDEFPDEED